MHGGARKNAGRKRGTGISLIIKKYCDEMVLKLFENEKIKNSAFKQLSFLNEEVKKEYLYILKSNGLYKIGYTSNLKKRINNYRSHGSSEFIYIVEIKNAFDIEVELHNKYSNCLKYGSEWYSFTEQELLNVISFITNKYIIWHEN